jgi:hypothetical protein
MSATSRPLAIAALAWLVPGAGHVATGQLRKGLVFFVVLVAMTIVGLAFGGRLFPFQLAEPLVFLAATAEWALGLPRFIAAMSGAGGGDVVAATYDYGNTFLIASGLLNMLVLLDAADRARPSKDSRKTR